MQIANILSVGISNCELISLVLLQVRSIFDVQAREVVTMRDPTYAERKAYFEVLFLCQAIKPPSSRKVAGMFFQVYAVQTAHARFIYDSKAKNQIKLFKIFSAAENGR